ncbi:MAG: Molybdopterin synthase catalytic subunit [Trizodia sp. TS-e1964]|nr:MAG: Molybdopterin synthase catalytic subunit [Trizodia sp. TS-e1964]
MDSTDQSLSIAADNIHVRLANAPLDAAGIISQVKSLKAGAVILFAGTTRDNFHGNPVRGLQYSAYVPRALATMLEIAKTISAKHSLTAICITHRLGNVPVGEESILIALSSPHRHAAWRAGEEVLEQCKARVEIWKLEEFNEDSSIWRSNLDAANE